MAMPPRLGNQCKTVAQNLTFEACSPDSIVWIPLAFNVATHHSDKSDKVCDGMQTPKTPHQHTAEHNSHDTPRGA